MSDVEKNQSSVDDDKSNIDSSHDSSATATPAEPAEESPRESKEVDEALAADTRTIHGWRWLLVCMITCSSAFLYGLDTTIAANIQGPAVETFGAVDKLAWVGVGFPLGSVAVILSVGKAYGTFNMKWLYISSMIMFEAGSALCGASPNMSALIVGRVWAGVGGAGIYLGGLNIVSHFTTIRERSIYIAMISIAWGAGCILGPVIGGAFADSSATWRWAFYINLVIFGATGPVIVFFLPSVDPRPDLTYMQKQAKIDWLGSLLNAAIYATFVVALTFGGAQWAWSSGNFVACIVMCGVLIVAFGIQQKFTIFTSFENRIFPLDFLTNPQLILHYILTTCAAAAAFVPLYYIPVFFGFVDGDNGITTAVRVLPFICTWIFCCMFNGMLMPVFGVYMPWYVVSEVFILVGSALFYVLVGANTSTATIYGLSVIIGVGGGLSAQASYSVVPAKVEGHRVPDAIGFINTAQIGGIVISLAISGTVFQNVAYRDVAQALSGLNFTSADIHDALAGAHSTVFTNTTPQVRQQVLQGIVGAIQDTYVLVIAAGAFGLICSLLLKRERLFMKFEGGG
ncbi:hypothetical protein MBLNU457_5182t1 [Dothideomycetes sp. NU457]